MRVDLKVPFSEKDAAKQLGARWDSGRKLWYVPDGVDAAAFNKWIPGASGYNLRAESYSIIQSSTTCWKCGRQTPVFGLLLPESHESLECGEESIDDEWITYGEPTILSYVTALAPDLQNIGRG